MEFPISPSEKVAAASCGAVLTIDRGRLRDLFLPSVAGEVASLDYMNKACLRAHGSRHYDALNTARCAVMRDLDRTVDVVVQRGGLLHVGVRGAL